VTLEDWYIKIRDDPKKRVRAFKFMWLVSTGMLIFGAFVIIWVLFKTP
jgi:hypothetical protein